MSNDRRSSRRAFGTDGVVAGRIIEAREHPHADIIRIALVDPGGEPLQIVFGGLDVVQVGDIVPVAPPGARVPARRKRMRVRRFRGQLSQGMLCSVAELGWAVQCPDEVARLDSRVPPGTSLDFLNEDQCRRIIINDPIPGNPILWGNGPGLNEISRTLSTGAGSYCAEEIAS